MNARFRRSRSRTAPSRRGTHRGFFGPTRRWGARRSERVFGRTEGSDAPLMKKRDGELGRFNEAQFTTFDAIPFDLTGPEPDRIRR